MGGVMTNEMKLIMALIDAMGYEVEEVDHQCTHTDGNGVCHACVNSGRWSCDYVVTKKKYKGLRVSDEQAILNAKLADPVTEVIKYKLNLDAVDITPGDINEVRMSGYWYW